MHILKPGRYGPGGTASGLRQAQAQATSLRDMATPQQPPSRLTIQPDAPADATPPTLVFALAGR